MTFVILGKTTERSIIVILKKPVMKVVSFLKFKPIGGEANELSPLIGYERIV